MTKYEIPLTNTPQTFQVQIGQQTYRLTLNWNKFAPAWMLDIADKNGNLILGSVPLVTGVDLLAQYAYLGFGGELWVQTDGDANAIPTFDNLGSQSHLYFITKE